MYVKKLIFWFLVFLLSFPLSFARLPAGGPQVPSYYVPPQSSKFEASTLKFWSLNPQILKPQPSKFEASTVKIWSLNPENFEAPSLSRQILKPSSPSILKILKPQASNFEASSLNPQILKLQASSFENSSLNPPYFKPQASSFEASTVKFWSLKPQILKPLVLKSSGATLCNNPPLKTLKFPTFLRVPFLFLSPFGRRPP